MKQRDFLSQKICVVWNTMFVLTVVATENPYTVFFDEPLPKADLVRLISCSLPNSWHNLKNQAAMSLRSKDGSTSSVKTLLEGHYTLEMMAKEIENIFKKEEVTLPAEINTYAGALVIYNLENRRIRLDRDLAEFFGTGRTLQYITFIKRLNSPSTYFVHCDLVDPARNLINGKKSNLLAMFDIRGKAFEKVRYQTGEQQDFRDASTGEHVNSVTLSVKDQNGELFDFQGQKLAFELAIN